MLKKNHASAFFMGIIYLAASLAVAVGLFFLLRRGPVISWPTPGAMLAAALILTLIFAVLLIFFSRSSLVMGLDEAVGFGLWGLLRWLTCGLISGFLVLVFSEYLLPITPLPGFLRNLFELLVNCSLLLMSYWLVFGYRVMHEGQAVASADLVKEWKSYRWMYLFAGLVFLAVYWIAAIQSLIVKPLLFWLSSGGVCLGLCLPLIGVQHWPGRSDGLDTRLTWAVFALAGLAFALFSVGILS